MREITVELSTTAVLPPEDLSLSCAASSFTSAATDGSGVSGQRPPTALDRASLPSTQQHRRQLHSLAVVRLHSFAPAALRRYDIRPATTHRQHYFSPYNLYHQPQLSQNLPPSLNTGPSFAATIDHYYTLQHRGTMFHHLATLVARDPNVAPNHTMINLLVVLLVLLILAVLLVAGLLVLRQRRRARKQQELPLYDEKRASTSSSLSNHRRILVRPSESVYVIQEKESLMDESTSPPPSPLPEIRITFPEEFDKETGKRQSGRVVVVRVGDNGVGLEPVESLPAYQKDESDRFQSIDLERVGGLVEKARNAPSKEFN